MSWRRCLELKIVIAGASSTLEVARATASWERGKSSSSSVMVLGEDSAARSLQSHLAAMRVSLLQVSPVTQQEGSGQPVCSELISLEWTSKWRGARFVGIQGIIRHTRS
jgi:hypothetical protein